MGLEEKERGHQMSQETVRVETRVALVVAHPTSTQISRLEKEKADADSKAASARAQLQNVQGNVRTLMDEVNDLKEQLVQTKMQYAEVCPEGPYIPRARNANHSADQRTA